MRHKLSNRIVVVVLLLVAVLGATSVSGQDPNHLLFLYWETGPEARPGWENLIAGFNEANPNITVELRGIRALAEDRAAGLADLQHAAGTVAPAS